MAIIRFTFDPSQIPAGKAVHSVEHNGAGYYGGYDPETRTKMPDKQGPTAYWTWLEHEGFCLSQYERNGYHDSDFVMVIWDPVKQEPFQHCFASTRGWSYPAYGSWADATDDVKAAFAAYQARVQADIERERRAERARELMELRAKVRDVARKSEAPYARVLRFARKSRDWEAIAALFGDRIRSKFKLSMREQVAKWLREPEPRYATPLSPKQMTYL